MSYRNRLNNWALARLSLPDSAFGSSADGHLQFLRGTMLDVQLKVVFNVTEDA